MPRHDSPNPKHIPFRQPTADEILSMLGCGPLFDAPALNFTIICNDRAQAVDITQRTIRAGARFTDLKPATVRPRAIAQRFMTMEEISQIASEEKASGETTGLALLIELCKVSPADLVLGMEGFGQALIADLKNGTAKMYPDRIGRFVTQSELERETVGRPFAGETDAFLMAAFGHLYGVIL